MYTYTILYERNGRLFTERVRAGQYLIEEHGVLTFTTNMLKSHSYHSWIKVEREQ